MTLNIAEGAGEFSTNEKIRFYRMARRSATECAGILDICMRLHLIDEGTGSKSRRLLLRIVSMLTKNDSYSFGNAGGHGNVYVKDRCRESFYFL